MRKFILELEVDEEVTALTAPAGILYDLSDEIELMDWDNASGEVEVTGSGVELSKRIYDLINNDQCPVIYRWKLREVES